MRFFRRVDPLSALRAMRNEMVHSKWEQNADRLYELISQLDYQKGKGTKLERTAFRLLMVPILAASHDGHPAVRARGGVVDWFTMAVFMIPGKIREPWVGDLREDRMEMARMGMPRWWIEMATGCQLLVLVGHILRDFVVEAVRIARRLE